MYQVEPICFQAPQTALDTFQERCLRPVGAAFHPVWMTAFREKVKIIATITDCFADQFFAAAITLSRVDYVQARIERATQKRSNCSLVGLFETDLGSAEPEHGNLHVRFTESAFLHRIIVGRFCETPIVGNGVSHKRPTNISERQPGYAVPFFNSPN